MRDILEQIKEGFGIAIEELLSFVFRIGGCLYLVVLPLAGAAIIPLLISLLLVWCEVECAFLIFKILLSLFQIVALSISMSMVDSDEGVSDNDSGNMFIPSKDLIVAVYVIFNLYIWGFWGFL